MQIIQSFITNNDNFRANRQIVVRGLMVHSVGTPQPDPEVFVRVFNVPRPNGRQVGVHAFVGDDGRVFQTLPWTHRAWHCGGSGNDTHIGIELTEPNTIRYTGGARFTDNNPQHTKDFVRRTYDVAVRLFAHLCKEFNLNPLADGVILSHAEGHRRGIAGNHGDVEHLWHHVGLTMDQFRLDIKAEMELQDSPAAEGGGYVIGGNPATAPSAPTAQQASEWARGYWAWATESGITDGTRPREPITREENVAMLHRYHNLQNSQTAGGYNSAYETSDTNPIARVTEVSQYELDALARLVWAEARGEGDLGMRLVVHVVLNRVQSPSFPNTIMEVIFQQGQFSPITNGQFDRATPGEEIYAAVRQALSEPDQARGALFFHSLSESPSWKSRVGVNFIFAQGNHRFYS